MWMTTRDSILAYAPDPAIRIKTFTLLLMGVGTLIRLQPRGNNSYLDHQHVQHMKS